MENQTKQTIEGLFIDFSKDITEFLFEVYLVNNTSECFKSIKMLSGGVISDEDTILETSKVVKDFGELKPYSKIKIDESDLGELDFKIWYWLDLINEYDDEKQFFASLPRGGGNENQVFINLMERTGKCIMEEIKDLNMDSQLIDMKKRREGRDSEFYGVEIVEKALEICIKAHEGQVRKGDEKPFFTHPIMVALKLASYGAPPEVIAAALTHDVLEDTNYTKEKLRKELNDTVVGMVEALTQDTKLSWKDKKSKYIESVRYATVDVKLISVADKIHNLESLIMAHKKKGKDIWKLFNGSREEKEWFETKFLEMLRSTKHPLIDEYEVLIEKEKRLE